MIERPHTHSPEYTDEVGDRYLRNFGIEWSDLEGKKVLDIGAQDAAFESSARRHRVDVTSLDMEIAEGEFTPSLDSTLVVARATKMPFSDGAFDVALAHMSVMNYREKGYSEKDDLAYFRDIFREVSRILKADGQFRFTDTTIDDNELRVDENDTVPDALSDEYYDWRIPRERGVLEEMAKRAGFQSLQLEIYPDTHPERDEYLITHYYIAKKSS
jgi:ubiquinone/menaquinone biosynthesis C-methylase UbiE